MLSARSAVKINLNPVSDMPEEPGESEPWLCPIEELLGSSSEDDSEALSEESSPHDAATQPWPEKAAAPQPNPSTPASSRPAKGTPS